SRLYTWINTDTASDTLFIVPPKDPILALTFRACTGRRLFTSVPEINQLAYSPALYRSDIARLNDLGMRVTGPRHDLSFDYLDFSDYYRMLQKGEYPSSYALAQYAVVYTRQTRRVPPRQPVVYSDETFTVLKLH